MAKVWAKVWAVRDLADDWDLTWMGACHVLKAAGLENDIQRVGRSLTVSEAQKRKAERWRTSRARKWVARVSE